MDQHTGGHDESSASAFSSGAGPPWAKVQGLALEQGGYLLQEISAPAAVGQDGDLSFTITGVDGAPVTAFETGHGKALHLIVVRSDGSHYRHVHPVMDQTGRWSLPWRWEAAGTYRTYADAVPAGADKGVTLTRTVDVAGTFDPTSPEVTATADAGGFQVSLTGGLSAGSASTLTASISRDGQPVTALQPYLGAYGHLVALRAGDLAYLHVHPEDVAPSGDGAAGPEVEFVATAPTPGRYYLYFDFQVDGTVHTAGFALDTTEAARPAGEGHSGH